MVKMSKVIPSEGYKFNFYTFQGEIFVFLQLFFSFLIYFIFNDFFSLLLLKFFFGHTKTPHDEEVKKRDKKSLIFAL